MRFQWKVHVCLSWTARRSRHYRLRKKRAHLLTQCFSAAIVIIGNTVILVSMRLTATHCSSSLEDKRGSAARSDRFASEIHPVTQHRQHELSGNPDALPGSLESVGIACGGGVSVNGLRAAPAKAREGAALQLYSDAGQGLDLLGGPGERSKPTCLETEWLPRC
jgi:hypothetical protein